MAENPNIKVNIDFSETITAAAVRLGRHTGALGLAVELASAVDPDRVQECLESFLPIPDGDIVEEIGHLRQAISNIQGNVTQDLEWLLAADERLKAAEAVRDAAPQTTTED